MSLALEIRQWDEASVAYLQAVYQRHSERAGFVSDVVEFLGDCALQKGASWLLKRYLQAGKPISGADTAMVFGRLHAIEHWQSKLNLLQSLSFMEIGEMQRKSVEAFVRHCLADDNTFVRAWAYDGFYRLAMQYPEYENEVKLFFDMALRDEAPSVKARIRNIMKEGFVDQK